MDAVYTRYRDNNNPSFSSTLLDEIYRSIDEQQPTVSRKTKSTKNSDCFRGDFDENRCFRGGLIRKWMEDEVVGRKSAAADLDRSSIRCGRDSLCVNSSSSSSDCSSAGHGGFCSSEGEFFGPRPIRTGGGINQREGFVNKTSSYGFGHGGLEEQKVVIKQESKFVKTKSKAMKIYSDLKKVKQPISPGGRLSSFLNSLFVTGNAKKSKTSSAVSAAAGDGGCTGAESCRLDRKSKSANASTCSSASSFSRSCLSNTPSSSSRGKSSNGLKRSVRFYPVSEVVDCGHKSLNEEEDEDEETGLRSVRFVKNSTNEEVRMKQTARNVLLKSYQKKIDCEFDSKHGAKNNDDDVNCCSDDGKSDSSSDLFELDNLAAIGMEKYREELPVYETTHLDTNRAIAYGRVR
ncbi:hypothetical protein OSB04_004762 [Centaurea solstitialis]|uniref:Protein BIG GRAIN 1-like B n=1 Tax=Centaurea solstitialis TaxID=347529 RepID=A0AA38TXQ7_9ASTR|nr:hypothetical protein OSB04_004762 [Centaurea solstitialis]